MVLTEHAVEWANDRVLRMLDLEAANRRLCLCLPDTVVSREPPDWIRHASRHEHAAVAWLVIENLKLAFPLYSEASRDGAIVAGTALTSRENRPGSVGANVHGDGLSALFGGASDRSRELPVRQDGR